jgi:hypothetical protein
MRALTSTDSGLGNYTLNLARVLLEIDKDLELLLVCTASRRQRWLHDPRIQEVVCPFPVRPPWTLGALGLFLRRQICDVFHSPPELTPRRLHRPVVVTIHDLNCIVNPRYNTHNLFVRLVGGALYRARLPTAMHTASRTLTVSHTTHHAMLVF